jgi:hypothetical protein
MYWWRRGMIGLARESSYESLEDALDFPECRLVAFPLALLDVAVIHENRGDDEKRRDLLERYVGDFWERYVGDFGGCLIRQCRHNLFSDRVGFRRRRRAVWFKLEEIDWNEGR